MPIRMAKILTFPQRVFSGNVKQLQAMVQNGPDIYPGACVRRRSPLRAAQIAAGACCAIRARRKLQSAACRRGGDHLGLGHDAAVLRRPQEGRGRAEDRRRCAVRRFAAAAEHCMRARPTVLERTVLRRCYAGGI